MEDMLQKIGSKIRTLRAVNNFSQENMADLLNMSPTGFAKIERGESDISITRLVQIAQAFKVPPTTLIGNEDNGYSFVNCSHAGGTGGFMVNQGAISFPDNQAQLEGLKAMMMELKLEMREMQLKMKELEKK